MKKLLSLALLLSACGDNNGTSQPDAPPTPDTPPDAGGFVAPTAFAVPLAAAGPDQLMAVAPGPNNTFYVAGFAAATVAGAKNIIVARLKAGGGGTGGGTGGGGMLDTTFNGDGIADTGVAFLGANDEIDLVVLPDGKMLVTGVVAAATVNPVDAGDRDIAIIKLDATGALDNTFGGGDGIAVFSLNTSILNTATPPAPVGRDGIRHIIVASDGKIYVHAYQRNPGSAGVALDTDFVVARILADGSALDTTWGEAGSGKYVLDIAGSSATPRGIALVNGQILASGYANSTISGNTTQPVLYKLVADGTNRDNAFAGGLFHEAVLAIQTEIYNFALHGNSLVTAGYGRNTGTTNDWVSMKFDATTGARDMTFGGVTTPVAGAVLFDPSGAMLGSNCRNAVAGPNGKTVLIGSIGPGNMPAQDAAFAVLDASGKLDTAFGDGIHTYKLGADGNDQFWGGAMSGGKVMIVGYKGGGMTQTDTVNDDSFGIILPMQ
jgi:uncharacterized delta-60 repeat protein